jgi:hypothetical protein
MEKCLNNIALYIAYTYIFKRLVEFLCSYIYRPLYLGVWVCLKKYGIQNIIIILSLAMFGDSELRSNST